MRDEVHGRCADATDGRARCDRGSARVLTGCCRTVSELSRRRSSRIPVANIKSQIKRNRQNEKRRVRNKAVRSELKTRVKQRRRRPPRPAPTTPPTPSALAVKRIDKAAAKGVIHKNQAARRKSRLMKRQRRPTASRRPP